MIDEILRYFHCNRPWNHRSTETTSSLWVVALNIAALYYLNRLRSTWSYTRQDKLFTTVTVALKSKTTKYLFFSPNSEKTNCEYQIRSYYTGILRYARSCIIRRTWKKNVLKTITTFLSVSCASLEKLSAQPIKSKAVWRVIKRNRPFINLKCSVSRSLDQAKN